MTKKILAAFLAVMMVISLLPATVGAAENAPQTNEVCPITDKYGDKGHDLAACEEFEIEPEFIETVAPLCELQGYDLFRCACGLFFGDNLTAKEHEFIPGEIVEEVEETCAADGVAEKIYCAVPGCTYFRGGEKIDNIDPEDVDAHTWGDAILDIDCTKGGHFECEICGEELDIEPAEEHDWDYENYVELTPPTCDAVGEVIIPCGNEGCTILNPVEIHMIPHDDSELVKVDAVAPSCEEDGNFEYYYCGVCEKNYFLIAGLYVEVEDADDLIDPATGHSNPDEDNPIAVVAPTCTKYGYTFYGCDICGKVFPADPQEPTGHSKYTADDLVSGGTCTTDSVYEWTCTNYANGVGGELCGEELEETVKAPGHSVVTVVVPATCKQVAYTFQYCDADNCELALKGEATKNGKTFDLSVAIDEDGNVIDTEGEVQFIKIVSMGTKTDATNHKWGVEEVNLPTCTVDGNHVYFCVDCSAYEAEIDKAPGHDYDEEHEDNIAADCTTDAYIWCDVCECLIAQEGTQLDHKYDDAANKIVVAPLCDGTKGYTQYGCSAGDCGTMGPQVEKTNFVALKEYATLEEAQAEHTAQLTDQDEFRAPSCEIAGLWKYTCADCEAAGRAKYVLVVIDGTGEGHKGAPEATELTCTQDSIIAEYVCQNPWCGETVEEELVAEATGHDMNHFEAVAPDCENDGVLEYWTCNNECCEDIFFADEDGETVYADEDAIVDPALGHNMFIYTVDPTCTRDGFTYNCCLNEGCDLEYADAYIPASGHDDIDDVTSVVIDATCEVDGSETWYCHCGEILKSEVIEAEGHINADDEVIVNICTDEVEDRVCVNENCDYADNGNVVPMEHDGQIGVYYPATCIRYGYWLYACGNEGCDLEDNIIVDTDNGALGHRLPYGVRLPEGEVVDADYLARYFEYIWGGYENYVEIMGEDAHCIEYIPATYEAAGSITIDCPDCAHTVTYVVEHNGVDFTLDIENAVVAGEAYVDSGIIAVNVKINAYQTNVWGFQFDVDYDATNLIYLGYTFNNVDFNGFHQATDNCYCDDHDEYIEWHYVTVMAYVENTPEGEKQNVFVEGSDDVITLYFQLNGAEDYAWFEIDAEYTDVRNADQEALISDGDNAGVEIGVFADGNGDNWATVADVQYAYYIASGLYEDNTYDSCVDINKDGWITAADVRLLADYATGAADYEDLFAIVDWELPEGFVPAA